jgi:DNA-binding IclR family transcriptional regulator
VAKLDAYAAGVKIDLKKYPRELAQIRARGYAVSREELIQGAVAVAAPFFNGSDRVTGSIGIFGPSVRLGDAKVEKFGKLLVREARKISKALGQAKSGVKDQRAPPS